MKKVPIVETIVSAYRFTFGDLGMVIGLIWLPLVIYTLGQFFVTNYVEAVSPADPGATGQATAILFGFSLVSVFLTAMIGVSLTRQAIAPRGAKVVAQFVISAAEFNYFFALLGVFLIMIAVYVASLIADFFLASLRNALAGGLAAAIGANALKLATVVLLFVLDLAVLLFIGVRLAFLVAPVTVAEGRIDLVRAWKLSRGNFWRMFSVILLTVGPIFVLGEIAFAVIVGPAYVIQFVRAFLGALDAVALGAAPSAELFDRLPDIASKTPMLLGLSFLLAPFTYGLLYAASAFTYRSLTDGLPSTDAPDVGPFRPA